MVLLTQPPNTRSVRLQSTTTIVAEAFLLSMSSYLRDKFLLLSGHDNYVFTNAHLFHAQLNRTAEKLTEKRTLRRTSRTLPVLQRASYGLHALAMPSYSAMWRWHVSWPQRRLKRAHCNNIAWQGWYMSS